MVEVVYYLPSIPSVRSTARYAHAMAFPDNLSSCRLITESDPPEAIYASYDEVHVLDGGTFQNALSASRLASDNNHGTSETVYVTTFHYAPVLSGVLADIPWVVDVYDDPLQYVLNNPRSHHEVTARILVRLISRAEGVVHDYHPHYGRVIGANPRFAMEGCPVGLIDPTYETPDEKLNCVWAGSPRLDRGMKQLAHALDRLECPVMVDVFGDVPDQVRSLVEQCDIDDRITLHGQRDHSTVCEHISRAHAGLCVLPERDDWYYSTPVKVREYMAGGTVPVVSDFPGMRLIAESAAVYTTPTPSELADSFQRLYEVSQSHPQRYRNKMQKSRQRAERQSLDHAGEWFVRQCISSGVGVQSF